MFESISSAICRVIVIGMFLGLFIFSGCNVRNPGTTLEYSESDVQTIRNELDNMDWS